MRLLAFLATLAALVAAVLAGQELWYVLNAPSKPAPQRIAAIEPAAPETAQPPRTTLPWPALFGEIAPPAPPEPVEAEPEPPEPEPQPPGPPLASLGYTLKGVIRTEGQVWAMISHPSGERILKQGDMLEEGLEVTRIDATGIWVDTGRDTPELLELQK